MATQVEIVPEISSQELHNRTYANLEFAIDTALEQYQGSAGPEGLAWRPKGFCVPDNSPGVPEELWFPEPRPGRPPKDGSSLTQLWVSVEDHEGLAKRACGGCAVIAQCREASLRNREKWGVFGGLTAAERSAMLGPQRARRKKAS